MTGVVAIITAFHAKYYAHELTRLACGDDVDRLSTSLFDASVDLNPHQIEAALFALRSPLSKGVVLADEVGLGKTIEAGLVLCQFWSERKRRLIVVCPAALRRQWAAELAEKFNLPVQILDAQTVRQLRKTGTLNPFDQRAVLILSYHYASRLEDALRAVPWDLVVMDEAHKLRNSHQRSHRMGQTLRRTFDGRRKLLLTATPLQNSLMELYGLASLIDEHLFGDDKAFRKQYLNSGADHGELRQRLTPFIKRNLRKQVLEYIRYTERRAITQPFTPSDDEQRLYDALSAFLLREEAFSLPKRQRHLTTLILRKLLASSSPAVAGTLERIHARLLALRDGQLPESTLIDELIDEDDLDDDYQEALEDAEDDAQDTPEATEQARLDDEISELAQYIDWARAIQTDGKTAQLLTALELGFQAMAQTGAARKAIIFTESRRTQSYLRDFLTANGFAGKLVAFNGDNKDTEATAIYQQWLADNQGNDKVTGSRPVDQRTALIEHFRDAAEIMIATEAAAEGVNLQFCSLVINYDLPWNPQRIEQRIGRCHRYGQKHDVVVVNFVNTRNQADQRVLELLTDKFKLFDGVFGASDEVLGRIESGIDFESRILSIYQSCRTETEIEQAFAALQQEMETDIAARMDETRQLLIEHFDEDIHDLLRLQLDRARERLDAVGRLFWALTRYALAERATFEETAPRFTLREPPDPAIPQGRYRLIRDPANVTDDGSEHLYRLTHPLGEHVLSAGQSAITPLAEVRFDISRHPTKLSVIEALKGERGWLALDLLAIETLQREEHLVFTAATDAGESLDRETCEKLFHCEAADHPTPLVGMTTPRALEDNARRQAEATISRIIDANNRFFQEERDKLEKWAEDKIFAAEQALQDTKSKLRALKRESRQAVSTEEQHALQVRIRETEREQRRQRQAIFDVEDEINDQRDTLIDALEQRLQQRTEIQRLFTIRWNVV
ncbi:SNF2-related protein [Thiorhodococcus mannitoliphagus]|uniref:SNF2-related protein n=1 Tax=Thiorhodococcus mannitoliphagus TaxID=329406 RepID=UPI0019801D95|nr:SNF2-related protein [Thiorhodococcus mannitoliphagus]